MYAIGKWSTRKQHYRRRVCRVLIDHLLHPNHVIPFTEFIAALVEFPDHRISHMAVKCDAVIRQICILRVGISNAGIQVQDMLRDGNLLKRLIKSARDSKPPLILL